MTFVIMAGGRGERLWPLVRARTPKVCLSPDGGRSLLQATIQRLRPVWPSANWLIVTTRAQAAMVRRGVPAALRRAVLVEPRICNTAACITLAAVTLANRDPQRLMVVVPADHWVGNAAAYRRAIRTAIRAAVSHDTLALIGVRPTHAHTGLGYLCAGAPIRGTAASPRVFRLARSVEKPSAAVARRLMRRPRTYWNSGIFVGTAEAFLARVTAWLPDHVRRLMPLAGQISPHRLEAAYRRLRPVSFDRGVMDHVRDGLVVEGRFPWADLGSWGVWAQLGRASSPALTVDSANVTVVNREPHLIATLGVRDLVVVHAPDATLICRADREQAVREVVKRLAADPRFASYR